MINATIQHNCFCKQQETLTHLFRIVAVQIRLGVSCLFKIYRGVDQLADRQAHNLKVAGSSPAPAIMGPIGEDGVGASGCGETCTHSFPHLLKNRRAK